MNPLWLRKFTHYFLTFFLLVSGFSYYLVQIDIKGDMLLREAEETHRVRLLDTLIGRTFGNIVSDLAFLSETNEVNRYLDYGSDGSRRELAAEYLSFINRKQAYDQIRFLDENGMERVRVNRGNDGPVVVPDDQLQDKGGRYYFRDTIGLEPGEIFASPLDLNVERGKVETPFKPVIRFGTPVYDQQKRLRGAVVINYLGDHLLDRLRLNIKGAEGVQLMLLNGDSHWLLSPNAGDEWGFMFPHRQQDHFAKRFPAAWPRIKDNEQGQFRNKDGLFTFMTSYPLLGQQIVTSHEPRNPGIPDRASLADRKYRWKVVSLLPETVLHSELRKVFDKFVFLYIVTVGLLLAGSWLLAEGFVRKRQADIALKESEERFRTLSDTATDAIILMDDRGRVSFWNPSAERMFGYDREEIIGRSLHDLLMPAQEREKFSKAFATFRKSGQGNNVGMTREISGQCKDGREIPLELSLSAVQIGGKWWAAGIARDITQRKALERKLSRMAHFDSLTALPNRERFFQQLQHDLALSRRQALKLAVLFCDLDGFKAINDTLGHDMGDKLLVEVAERLKAGVREMDTVARMGGDEFTVILPLIGEVHMVTHIVHRLIDDMARPFDLAGHACHIGVSIGIAIYPLDGEEADMLIKAADDAMYEAKASGKNGFRFAGRQ